MSIHVSPTDSTSTSLLGRLHVGDQLAWADLVRLYGPLVWSWCRDAKIRSADAADVFQTVFASVHAGLPAFRRDSAEHTFRGWLRTIARNAIADHYRRVGREGEAIGGSAALARIHQLTDQSVTSLSSDPQEAEETERQLLLRQALEMLRPDFSERVWQAFLRTTTENASSPIVAQELEMTADAVRQAKARVLRRLRKEFDGLIDDDPVTP